MFLVDNAVTDATPVCSSRFSLLPAANICATGPQIANTMCQAMIVCHREFSATLIAPSHQAAYSSLNGALWSAYSDTTGNNTWTSTHDG